MAREISELAGSLNRNTHAGELGGFPINVAVNRSLGNTQVTVSLHGAPGTSIEFPARDLHEADPAGLVIRLENRLARLEERQTTVHADIEHAHREIEHARHSIGKPFPHATELATARERAQQIDETLERMARPEQGDQAAQATTGTAAEPQVPEAISRELGNTPPATQQEPDQPPCQAHADTGSRPPTLNSADCLHAAAQQLISPGTGASDIAPFRDPAPATPGHPPPQFGAPRRNRTPATTPRPTELGQPNGEPSLTQVAGQWRRLQARAGQAEGHESADDFQRDAGGPWKPLWDPHRQRDGGRDAGPQWPSGPAISCGPPAEARADGRDIVTGKSHQERQPNAGRPDGTARLPERDEPEAGT